MPNEKLVKIKRKRHSRSGEEIIIMKNLKKLTALAGICAVTVASLAACGQSGTTTETKADTNAAQTEAGSQAAESTADSAKDTQAASEASADLSGSITMAGSTSMEKLANAVAEAFMEKYPNVTVNAEFTGSSAGIESLLSGSVDTETLPVHWKTVKTEWCSRKHRSDRRYCSCSKSGYKSRESDKRTAGTDLHR